MNKILIISIIVCLTLFGIGLFFLISNNKKDNSSLTDNQNMNNTSNQDNNESIPNNDEELNQETTIEENKDEQSVTNNHSTNNNSINSNASTSSNSSSSNTSTNSNSATSNPSVNNDSKPDDTQSNNTNTEIETPKPSIASTFTAKSLKTSEGINLKYWLYTPNNPTSNMPLIIYLHGGSAKGDDLQKVVEGSFPKFLKNGELGNLNAYVVMPQVPSNYKGWSDIKVSVKDLINNIKSTYNINQNKISLTGHSMGGKGTYDIALAYPTLFSCIAPMSGSITVNDININKLKNVPIWAFVGSSDTIVDPSTSTNFITEIKKYNSNSKLTTFDGATHFDVPELGYKNTDVINWLISNSK